MSIVTPIFIIGTGRCGSTVFHEMFARHPHVAWLSALCNKFVDKPEINKLYMELISLKIIENQLVKKIKPNECYDFWEKYSKGFSEPCRDLHSFDVTNKSKNNIQKVLSIMLTKKRRRLLIKITGWPRLGYIKEVFKDAKFIHVVRDGRSVVNSMINVDWWGGWRGPQNWRWGELTQAQMEEWERYDKSFLALAAIEIKILMEALQKAQKYINKHSFFEIKYEDLCSNHIEVFKEVISFCNLDWTNDFEKTLKTYTLKNTNNKWKKELTESQHKIITEILRRDLEKYGYL